MYLYQNNITKTTSIYTLYYNYMYLYQNNITKLQVFIHYIITICIYIRTISLNYKYLYIIL